MKHPSEYQPQTIGDFAVMVVDAGTVIKDDASGKEETVTDGSVVKKGRVLYCTAFMERALKIAIKNQ